MVTCMSLGAGLKFNTLSSRPRHGRTDAFSAGKPWKLIGAVCALVVVAFMAGNWFGSIAAVDAFTHDHDSPVTAPVGYRCWNEIHASAPDGFTKVCGIVQEPGSPG
jgi:hypothetical protein